ncbi:MAG: DUF2207 domain-containing protein [Dokdonella sp.]
MNLLFDVSRLHKAKAALQKFVQQPLLVALCVLLSLASLPSDAKAAEEITRYDVLIEVAADTSLTITEQIVVNAEGNQIRRGIYRDFPTKYKDRLGNQVHVDFQVLDVHRDGNVEPWFTERISNGVRVNTGGDSFLSVPASYAYTLRYHTNRQLGFFEDHDELYFNAIGTGWAFPVESATVEVRLPEPVPTDSLKAEGYTGPQGAKGSNYRASTPRPGVAAYELTSPLQAGEGFTVVLGFPKGIVQAPAVSTKVGWFLRDNAGAGVALFGLLGVLMFYLRRWYRLGRDPASGPVFPHYNPPDGISPALLRYVWKNNYSPRCFAGDLVELAVRGLVVITSEKNFLAQAWSLQRSSKPLPTDLPPSQVALIAHLFKAGPTIALLQSNHLILGAAKAAQTASLKADTNPHYIVSNMGTVGKGVLISAAVLGLAAWLAHGNGIVVIVVVAITLLVITMVFARLMQQPTADGRKLLDQIAGLRQYLSVAERDELHRLAGPDVAPAIDADRYEKLLPYALALDVEDAWTKRFISVVGVAAAAEATRQMGWYSGTGISNIGDVSKALGSSLSSSIASSSSPPGSSSGGGGGGSSGGGGGGGGGGGR